MSSPKRGQTRGRGRLRKTSRPVPIQQEPRSGSPNRNLEQNAQPGQPQQGRMVPPPFNLPEFMVHANAAAEQLKILQDLANPHM